MIAAGEQQVCIDHHDVRHRDSEELLNESLLPARRAVGRGGLGRGHAWRGLPHDMTADTAFGPISFSGQRFWTPFDRQRTAARRSAVLAMTTPSACARYVPGRPLFGTWGHEHDRQPVVAVERDHVSMLSCAVSSRARRRLVGQTMPGR